MIGKNLRKSNLTVAFNVLDDKNDEIYPAYVLKRNSKCKNSVILSMISNGEGWHCIAVKKLPALLREIRPW